MIQLKIGNNLKRATVMIDEETTIRQALEAQEINFASGVTTLDGAPLRPGDFDKSFKDFGITERCTLLSVIKADNALR